MDRTILRNRRLLRRKTRKPALTPTAVVALVTAAADAFGWDRKPALVVAALGAGAEEANDGPVSVEALVVPSPVTVDPSEVFFQVMAHKSKNTVAAYRRDLKAFGAFLGLGPEGVVKELLSYSGPQANAVISRWLEEMRQEGKASATLARRLSTLRVVVEMARSMELITWSLFVPAPYVENVRDVRGPPEEDFAKLLAACGDGASGLRNRLIVLLMGSVGLRRVEVARLVLADYDRPRRSLRIHGKGDRKLQRTLPQPLAEMLEAWILEAKLVDPAAPIIASFSLAPKKAGPINLHGLNYIIRKIGKRAGVKVWPHALRHAAITAGLGEFDIRTMQHFSRHKDVRTVLRYDDDVKDISAKVGERLVEKWMGKKEGTS